MLYLKDNRVYHVDGEGKAHKADVTAKDKVVQVRELESVTVTPAKAACKLPEGARPVTVDELVRKFAISEKNPLKFPKE